MENVDILREFKREIDEKYIRLFAGEVRFNYKNKGVVKWIANRDKLNIVYANLLRTISSKSYIKELNKLKRSIENNKFSTQFNIFVKYYTNNYGSMEDMKSSNCPKLTPSIPTNYHKHDKYYFVTIIIDWYISYFLWKNKLLNATMKLHTKELLDTQKNNEETHNEETHNQETHNDDKNIYLYDSSYSKASVDSFGSCDSDDEWYESFKQSTSKQHLIFNHEEPPIFQDSSADIPDYWDD